MRRSLSEGLSDAVRPYSRGLRLAYLLVSASVMVLEVVFQAILQPLEASDVLSLAALCVLLAVAPWLGCVGDLLYVGAFAVAGMPPESQGKEQTDK